MLCNAALCYACGFIFFSVLSITHPPPIIHSHFNPPTRTFASTPLPVAFASSLCTTLRRLLTRLQLLKIEATRPHIPPGLVEALRELCRIRCTWPACLLPVAARLAVVQVVVHRLGVRVRGVRLVGLVVVGLRRGCFLRGTPTAAEESPDRVSDGRPDCYTTACI
jgi:hypothetical protein